MYLVQLWRAELKGIKSLMQQNFSKTIYGFWTIQKINEKGILPAEESYRALKQYFIDNGRYREASWASFKEKTMEKLWLKKNKNPTYVPTALISILLSKTIFSGITFIIASSLLQHLAMVI